MMARKGVGLESEIDTIIGWTKTTTDMGVTTSDAQLVIEAIPANLELEQKVSQELDQPCPPKAILTTNTSVISITEIASKARGRERIVGTHFWNPPYLIPLVEAVRGKEASDRAMDTTYQVMKDAGKHPVKVMKDVPGFITNRLQ